MLFAQWGLNYCPGIAPIGVKPDGCETVEGVAMGVRGRSWGGGVLGAPKFSANARSARVGGGSARRLASGAAGWPDIHLPGQVVAVAWDVRPSKGHPKPPATSPRRWATLPRLPTGCERSANG